MYLEVSVPEPVFHLSFSGGGAAGTPTKPWLRRGSGPRKPCWQKPIG